MNASSLKVLIVEDNITLAKTLENVILDWGFKVQSKANIQDGLKSLASTKADILLLDYKLPDGDAIDFLVALNGMPWVPTVIAMSACAEPTNTFSLAMYGVRAYVQKPVDINVLKRTVFSVMETQPNIRPYIRAAVGASGIKDVEKCVRDTMVAEALNRSQGNRTRAAKLLKVSRQFLQHIIQKAHA